MSLFAYLDPITGSAIMQVALGALAAIGLGWQYIRRGFRMTMDRFRGEPGPESQSVDSDQAHVEAQSETA